MKNSFTKGDIKKIKDTIRIKYSEVSVTPKNLFQYPTGLAGLKALNYDPDIVRSLPESVTSSFCGVGNPFSLGKINSGEKVLDIGCGGGVDTMVASSMSGPTGQVVGIDISADMIQRARKNLDNAALKNVVFQSASPEDLPFPDQFFEVVISNGVFNLVPDKAKALAEVFRVLKPHGRFMIADQAMFVSSSKDIKEKIANWANWEGGAIPGKDFLVIMKQVGFADTEYGPETGFNSSPFTKGVLFKARKPAISTSYKRKEPSTMALSTYQDFFDSTYADGALDRKMKHLIALGASLASGCEPWTRYCLAVAKQSGATEEELQETMAIAMTVGATKIQILQQNCLASLANSPDQKEHALTAETPSQEEAVCVTWTSQTRSGWVG